jgi:hypothetical protein
MAHEQEQVIRAALDDIALVIGGTAALHHLDDDLVWSIMKRMDRIRVNLFRELSAKVPDGGLRPARMPATHPAVGEFIERNRRGHGE